MSFGKEQNFMPDKILIVDDETEIADLIEVYLKNEEYTVFKFYTAEEALKCIQTTPLDLAILDVMLPDINGFRPLEMVARVKSQLRRYKKYNLSHTSKTEHVLHCSDLVVNTKKHECLLNDKPVSLTPTAFAILQILLENKGDVISGEELFHRIWKDEYYIKSNNTITVHIRRLREKLNDTLENPKYIKTIWGVGYKIDEE